MQEVSRTKQNVLPEIDDRFFFQQHHLKLKPIRINFEFPRLAVEKRVYKCLWMKLGCCPILECLYGEEDTAVGPEKKNYVWGAFSLIQALTHFHYHCDTPLKQDSSPHSTDGPVKIGQRLQATQLLSGSRDTNFGVRETWLFVSLPPNIQGQVITSQDTNSSVSM